MCHCEYQLKSIWIPTLSYIHHWWFHFVQHFRWTKTWQNGFNCCCCCCLHWLKIKSITKLEVKYSFVLTADVHIIVIIIIGSGFVCRTDRVWIVHNDDALLLFPLLNVDSFNVTNGQTFPLKFISTMSYYIADVLLYVRAQRTMYNFTISVRLYFRCSLGRLAKRQFHVQPKNMDLLLLESK